MMPAIGRAQSSTVFWETAVGFARDTMERARATAERVPLLTIMQLPKLTVEVRCGPGSFGNAIRQGLFQLDPQPDGQPRMTVIVADADTIGMPASARFEGEGISPHQLAATFERAGLRYDHHYDLAHWHLFDIDSDFGLQLMEVVDGFPPWETGSPLRPFLHWHYAKRGLRVTHGGTLGVDGRGVLLAGAGGSGKSGTVIGGILNGLRTVGDDYVLLEGEADVVSYPLFSVVKRDPAGFARLGLARFFPSPLPLNWQGKHQFSIGEIAPEAIAPRLEIGAIIVPRVEGLERSHIGPMTRAEAMIALSASSIHQMPGERESGFRFFSKVTRRLPCFRMALGRHPAEVADALATFIEGM